MGGIAIMPEKDFFNVGELHFRMSQVQGVTKLPDGRVNVQLGQGRGITLEENESKLFLKVLREVTHNPPKEEPEKPEGT
jgi:hypothetical protein